MSENDTRDEICPICGGLLSVDEYEAGECAHSDCNWKRGTRDEGRDEMETTPELTENGRLSALERAVRWLSGGGCGDETREVARCFVALNEEREQLHRQLTELAEVYERHDATAFYLAAGALMERFAKEEISG